MAKIFLSDELNGKTVVTAAALNEMWGVHERLCESCEFSVGTPIEHFTDLLRYALVEVAGEEHFLTTALNSQDARRTLALGELYRVCHAFPGLADAVIGNAAEYAADQARFRAAGAFGVAATTLE